MNNLNIKDIIKRTLLIIGIFFRSIFKATIEVISGMVSFIFLVIGIFYLKEKEIMSDITYEHISPFILKISIIVFDNLKLFWWAIFLLVLYDNWYRIRELNWDIMRSKK